MSNTPDRFALCPNMKCRRRVTFAVDARFVRCGYCRTLFDVRPDEPRPLSERGLTFGRTKAKSLLALLDSAADPVVQKAIATSAQRLTSGETESFDPDEFLSKL